MASGKSDVEGAPAPDVRACHGGSFKGGSQTSLAPWRTSLSAEAAERIHELLTFEGAEDVCRAAPLYKILGSVGSIFAGSAGSVRTYSMSLPVKELNAFLSHNWATPRIHKFCALGFHYQYNGAAIFSVSCLCLGGFATAAGWLPTVPDQVYGTPVGFCCRFFFVPIFMLYFFFAADVLRALGSRGPLVFLDKVCIHQSDPVVMMKGIQKLGAFIGVSRRMVVLYSDLYLNKLWTVFEVASFLTQHSVDDLDVVPVAHSQLFLKAMCYVWFFPLATLCLRTFSNLQFVTYIISAVATYTYMSAVRRWARTRKEVLERLSRFSVRSSSCAVEADRPAVYGNIALLMAARQYVARDADEDEALDAFDRLVRQVLPGAFSTAFGTQTFAYKHYLLLSFVVSGGTCADYLAYAAAGKPFWEVLVWSLFDLIWIFTILPQTGFLLDRLGQVRLDLSGWRSRLLLLAMVLLVWCILVSYHVASVKFVQDFAMWSWLGVLIMVLAASVGPLMSCAFVRGWRIWPVRAAGAAAAPVAAGTAAEGPEGSEGQGPTQAPSASLASAVEPSDDFYQAVYDADSGCIAEVVYDV